MKITCFEDLAAEAKKMKEKTVIAVVEAQDENTIESVIEAARNGIMVPRLIGNAEKIESMLLQLGADPKDYFIHASCSVFESLDIAVKLINSGSAGSMMKGKLDSGDFIRAIVNRDNNLLAEGSLLSVAGFFDPPQYHKIIAISDVALNTYPDLEGKKAILENAVGMLNALGNVCPKTAVLAAVEKLNPKMPETVDGDALKKMNQSGEIKNCVVEAPISFDLATSEQAAKIKDYVSPVAGDADLLIVPNITVGNILAKSLTGFAGAKTAGTVLGAKIPVVLTSRSAEASDKYYSIALAACVAAYRG